MHKKSMYEIFCNDITENIDWNYSEKNVSFMSDVKYKYIFENNLLNGAIVKYEQYDFQNNHIVELDCRNTKLEFNYLRLTFKGLYYDLYRLIDQKIDKTVLYKTQGGFKAAILIYIEDLHEIEEEETFIPQIEAKELVIEEIENISDKNYVNEYYKHLSEQKGEEFKLKILQQWQNNDDIGYYYRFNELISMSKVITDQYDRLKRTKNLKVSKDIQYFVENFDFRECTVNDFGKTYRGDFYIRIESGPSYFEFNEDDPEVELLQIRFIGVRELEANYTGSIHSCCIKIDFDNSIEFQLLVGVEEYTVIKVHAEDLIIDFMK
ncbi:hypothetical protein [Terrisporobacter mayombei]|uniref:Uncharacterized protein n=1 Tax=Terrisporobacter mayombei TaxID=1541 RepID=A0ABY9Q427_9FIRM|nr:hypothetical protein [Terrisporobacter mayombei]MCC3870113.1 hypothetical protein [Terrisporobacter mayombei]WMT82349.1 hypothetical protein TEMA_27200 [Terrisporobacter mayombei]